MGSELGIVALYGLLIVLVQLFQVLMLVPQHGMAYLATARDESRPNSGVAARLERTIANCIVGMALFAPAVLILNAQGLSTTGTLLAAQIFLIARVVYVVVYAAGIPWVRTAVWVVALWANIYLYWVAL